jgi:type I restriction enzyme S subunit
VEKTIGDLGRVVTGKTPSTKNQAFYGGDYPFVTPTDLDWQSYYVRKTHSTVTDAARDQHKNQFLPENAVAFTCIGNTIGKCGIASQDCLSNQQINSVIANDEHDPKFIYYLMNYNRPKIRSIGLSGGAAQPIINKSAFSSISVSVPEEKVEQERIAEILSTYDELIENNRRRIELLEESARLLYREWFVHFRFPGYEHVELVDGVPKGWEMNSFDSLGEYLNGFAFKPHHLGDQGLPIVKIPELKGGILDKTPRYDGSEVPSKYILESGDLVFSWSGTLAIDYWVSGPAYLNQHLFKVTPNEKVSHAFLLIAIREAMPQFMNRSVGATMKHIRRSALREVEIALPNDSILDDFLEIVNAVYAQVRLLKRQNIQLAAARDLLLPRLMDRRLEV